MSREECLDLCLVLRHDSSGLLVTSSTAWSRACWLSWPIKFSCLKKGQSDMPRCKNKCVFEACRVVIQTSFATTYNYASGLATNPCRK